MTIKDFEKLLDAKLETVHIKLNDVVERLNRGDKKYAGKWVESIAVGVLTAILGGVALIIIKTV